MLNNSISLAFGQEVTPPLEVLMPPVNVNSKDNYCNIDYRSNRNENYKEPVQIQELNHRELLADFDIEPLLPTQMNKLSCLSSIENRSQLPLIKVLLRDRWVAALVDTGSEVSCISETLWGELDYKNVPLLPVVSTHLQGATGKLSKRVKYQVWLPFSLETDDVTFKYVFLIVSDLISPIIFGADWLQEVHAQINFETNCLYFSQVGRTFPIPFVKSPYMARFSVVSNPRKMISCHLDLINLRETMNSLEDLQNKAMSISTITSEQQENLFRIFELFQPVFNHNSGRTNLYVHDIKLHTTTPFIRRAYPIPHNLRNEVDNEINRMLALGIIARMATPYISPMTVVRKKDGGVRICLDARWLNSLMVADSESPRSPEDIFLSFNNVQYISTIDLRMSFWQIPLSPSSRQYTGFLYNGKSYVYLVLPFGLKTAVGTFSRAMDVILGPEVREFCINYIDDLLVYSSSFKEHLAHLSQVFEKLHTAGMTINLTKSQVVQEQVTFLGHIISPKGISTDPEKVRCIQEFPRPHNLKALRGFLGLCNYYRRFAAHYSEATRPLTLLLQKNVKWRWGSVEEESFNLTKLLFLETVILKFPNFDKTFYLQTDGSCFAIGVELYQLDLDNTEHLVLGFASRAFKGAELNYTVTEKELFAIIFGLQKFRTIILGCKVIIRTDHHALKFLKNLQNFKRKINSLVYVFKYF